MMKIYMNDDGLWDEVPRCQLTTCFETEEEMEKYVEKQEKYRWHDLRKDPNDLPPLKKRVDVRSKLGNSYYDWLDIYNADSVCWHSVSYSDEIVAWREIEPFESEVEES